MSLIFDHLMKTKVVGGIRKNGKLVNDRLVLETGSTKIISFYAPQVAYAEDEKNGLHIGNG